MEAASSALKQRIKFAFLLYVGYDNIISTKEKQAAAKQTFVFLVLISEHASAESRQEVRSTCM